jgi:hypothetical protein
MSGPAGAVTDAQRQERLFPGATYAVLLIARVFIYRVRRRAIQVVRVRRKPGSTPPGAAACSRDSR